MKIFFSSHNGPNICLLYSHACIYHDTTQVKIIYIFDSSSTASLNNSADSNLISLRLGFWLVVQSLILYRFFMLTGSCEQQREASDHIMKHLNQLLLPTISSKSPANNDTGSWRSSSAEPSNAVFNEDLVKVMMIWDNTNKGVVSGSS